MSSAITNRHIAGSNIVVERYLCVDDSHYATSCFVLRTHCMDLSRSCCSYKRIAEPTIVMLILLQKKLALSTKLCSSDMFLVDFCGFHNVPTAVKDAHMSYELVSFCQKPSVFKIFYRQATSHLAQSVLCCCLMVAATL